MGLNAEYFKMYILRSIGGYFNNTIDILVDDLIKNYAEDQPYILCCRKCGRKLKRSVKLGDDFDMTIEVEPCECILEE